MIKQIIKTIPILLIYSCGIFDSEQEDSIKDKIYIAMQALDKVAIVDYPSAKIDTTIEINFDTISCVTIQSESDCNAISACYWHNMGTMSHCMEIEDECISYDNQLDCEDNSICEWHASMGHCMTSGETMNMGSHTPHFIVIDAENKYWFVTTITSGWVGRYQLGTNQFIDKVFVGDSPALMTMNTSQNKLYVSRMMPMAGMMEGSVSSVIQEIDYSDPETMRLGRSIDVKSPTPHGIEINDIGEIFTASNTADWIWKINEVDGSTDGKVMDEIIGNSYNMETQRLKPIQIETLNDSLLMVTCSGGIWVNGYTQVSDSLAGQVQLWNTKDMTLVDSYSFHWKSRPWHIVSSSDLQQAFVVLSGDNLYPGSAGVVCLNYSSNELSLQWETYDDTFVKLHGIELSGDGERLYVSGRGDGKLHIFTTLSGNWIKSIELEQNAMSGGIAVYSKD